MNSFPAVQSVARAFSLLAEINRIGTATVGNLHKQTRIPKPTIVRLLETLIGQGYVFKDHRMGGYQVTSKAAELSSGYHSAPLVLEAGRPWAIDLTRRLKWPTSICTLEGDGVVVRYSTIADSPISPFHSTIGMKISLAARAMGRAYLCFCPEKERAILYEVLSKSSNPENHISRAELDRIVAVAQRNGFAERDRKAEPFTSATVAMPLKLDDRVLATIGVTYFRSALPAAKLEETLIVPMRETVAGIERELRALSR